MRTLRALVLLPAAALLSSCATLGENPEICGVAGSVLLGGLGGWAGHEIEEDGAFGITTGVVVGGAAGGYGGYKLCQLFEEEPEPEPEPRRAPPPPEPEPPPPPDPCAERFTFPGVNFDFDEATIRTDATPILERVAIRLNECRDTAIRIGGHTDSTGPEAYNQRLSERRANSVREYLVGQGVAAGRLTATGYGESQPVADNATREGRAQNRRVELTPSD